MKLASRLAQRLVDDHPLDAASALELLPLTFVASLLSASRPDAAARVLKGMTPHRAALVLQELPIAYIALLFDALPPDTAAALLRRSEEGFRTQVLESLSGRVGRTLRTLLHYATDSAATRMDPHVLAVPDDMTVKEALKQVRDSAKHVLFNLYVVDRQNVLVGVMNLRELLTSPPEVHLHDVMKKNPFRIAAEAERRAILEHPGWRQVHSLPVVDAHGRFLGALRYRTLRRLQADAEGSRGEGREAVTALAELFWTGVASVLDTVTMAAGREPAVEEEKNEN